MSTEFWTMERDEFVKRNWAGMTSAAIGAVLGISPQCVYNRAMKLGLPKKPGNGANHNAMLKRINKRFA